MECERLQAVKGGELMRQIAFNSTLFRRPSPLTTTLPEAYSLGQKVPLYRVGIRERRKLRRCKTLHFIADLSYWMTLPVKFFSKGHVKNIKWGGGKQVSDIEEDSRIVLWNALSSRLMIKFSFWDMNKTGFALTHSYMIER